MNPRSPPQLLAYHCIARPSASAVLLCAVSKLPCCVAAPLCGSTTAPPSPSFVSGQRSTAPPLSSPTRDERPDAPCVHTSACECIRMRARTCMSCMAMRTRMGAPCVSALGQQRHTYCWCAMNQPVQNAAGAYQSEKSNTAKSPIRKGSFRVGTSAASKKGLRGAGLPGSGDHSPRTGGRQTERDHTLSVIATVGGGH